MKALLYNYLHKAGTLDEVRTPEDFSKLCAAVAADTAGRLRWQLERSLGLPPWDTPPGRDEYLYASAQLQQDREEALSRLCPACRETAERNVCRLCGAALPTQNPAFDHARYEELKQYDPAL